MQPAAASWKSETLHAGLETREDLGASPTDSLSGAHALSEQHVPDDEPMGMSDNPRMHSSQVASGEGVRMFRVERHLRSLNVFSMSL